MANDLNVEGEPDDLVTYQLKLPLWMKRAAAECADGTGVDTANFIRAALAEAIAITRRAKKEKEQVEERIQRSRGTLVMLRDWHRQEVAKEGESQLAQAMLEAIHGTEDMIRRLEKRRR